MDSSDSVLVSYSSRALAYIASCCASCFYNIPLIKGIDSIAKCISSSCIN